MAEEQAQQGKKKSRLKWLVLLIILLMLGGGGAAAWHFFLADMLAKRKETPAETQASSSTPSASGAPEGQIVTLPDFRVNLADPLGRRFIMLGIGVEAVSPAAAAELQNFQAPIRDAIILLLSSKSYADLSSLESKMILKNEITDRINQILGGSKVSQIYITNLLIQ